VRQIWDKVWWLIANISTSTSISIFQPSLTSLAGSRWSCSHCLDSFLDICSTQSTTHFSIICLLSFSTPTMWQLSLEECPYTTLASIATVQVQPGEKLLTIHDLLVLYMPARDLAPYYWYFKKYLKRTYIKLSYVRKESSGYFKISNYESLKNCDPWWKWYRWDVFFQYLQVAKKLWYWFADLKNEHIGSPNSTASRLLQKLLELYFHLSFSRCVCLFCGYWLESLSFKKELYS